MRASTCWRTCPRRNPARARGRSVAVTRPPPDLVRCLGRLIRVPLDLTPWVCPRTRRSARPPPPAPDTGRPSGASIPSTAEAPRSRDLPCPRARASGRTPPELPAAHRRSPASFRARAMPRSPDRCVSCPDPWVCPRTRRCVVCPAGDATGANATLASQLASVPPATSSPSAGRPSGARILGQAGVGG